MVDWSPVLAANARLRSEAWMDFSIQPTLHSFRPPSAESDMTMLASLVGIDPLQEAWHLLRRNRCSRE